MSTTPQVTPEQPQEFQVIPDSQAFSMPLEDLKQAAFSPQSEPVQQQQPTAAQPGEKFSVVTDANGVTLTLAPEYGGEVYKGKDYAEALGKLAGSKAEANAYIKQLRNGQPEAPALPEFLTLEQEEAGQREAAEFLRGLILTPEVKQQIADEAIAARFGIDPQRLPQTVQQITEAHGQFQLQAGMMDFFQACPDYQDTPENSAALASYFPDDFAQRNGRLPNAHELKTAYALGRYEGKIQVAAPQQPISRPPLMPSASGTGPGHDNQSEWTIPLDVLKKAAGLG